MPAKAPQIRSTSWIHEALYVAPSRIHGQGVFTKADLPKGTVVIVWGGILYSTDDIKAGKAKRHSIVAIDDGLWLGADPRLERTADDYMNHSCDPNVWLRDAITLETTRVIARGEELVADYAIWLDDEDYVMETECNCGASWCRKRITGRDWALDDVIRRNFDHFSPFLNRRIGRLRNER